LIATGLNIQKRLTNALKSLGDMFSVSERYLAFHKRRKHDIKRSLYFAARKKWGNFLVESNFVLYVLMNIADTVIN
jgi:hypothetical protein